MTAEVVRLDTKSAQGDDRPLIEISSETMQNFPGNRCIKTLFQSKNSEAERQKTKEIIKREKNLKCCEQANTPKVKLQKLLSMPIIICLKSQVMYIMFFFYRNRGPVSFINVTLFVYCMDVCYLIVSWQSFSTCLDF